MATGNYNAVTAQLYEDIGMFTCDPDIGADATDLFNYLTGYSAKKEYRKLLVAPVNLRQGMDALIDREIEHQKQTGQGHMILKMNSLVDPLIIRKLYRASQTGVKVDLIVRGMCCLRRASWVTRTSVSALWSLLEHSRVYYFIKVARTIYLGSRRSDARNINHRVRCSSLSRPAHHPLSTDDVCKPT